MVLDLENTSGKNIILRREDHEDHVMRCEASEQVSKWTLTQQWCVASVRVKEARNVSLNYFQ